MTQPVKNKGGFMAQHEHTIVVTNGKPIVLTEMNQMWNLQIAKYYDIG